MSDDHNPDEPSATDDSTDSVNRRRFVKALGAASGAAVFGTTGIASTAASSSGADPLAELEIDELAGQAKKKSVATARRTDEFKRLRKYFRKEYNAKTNRTLAFEIAGDSQTGDEGSYTLVRFVLDAKKPKGHEQKIDHRNVEMVIALQNGAAVGSKAGVIDELSGGEVISVTTVQEKGGSIETETAEANLSESLAENDFVTIQHHECGVCKTVVRFVCKHGCGLGTIGICFVLFPGPGGVGCSVVAHFVCQRVDQRDCRRRSARNLCRYYGYC